MSNQAAWLDSPTSRLRVGEADMPTIAPNELIIRNRAVAVNPVDWKVQDYGIFKQEWPTTLGTDTAGEVYEVGSNVTRFKKGDRVIAHATISSEPKTGAFQLYTLAKEAVTAHLPASITFAQGSVLPLAIDTAQVGLTAGFGLPVPLLSSNSSNSSGSNKTIVLWGASSSVGTAVLQLATAVGVKVVATASPHNHALVKDTLGASNVFDHKSPTVVQNVVDAVKALGGEFVGLYDAISVDVSFKAVVSILEQLGGGTLAVVQPGPKVPSNIKIHQVFGENELTHPVWEHYITPALEQGRLLPLPEPLVIGQGLENVQKGLDENKKGVSARKVVIEL